MYCDNFLPLNLNELANNFFNHRKSAQITVYSNKYSMTKNNVLFKKNKLIKYDKSRTSVDLNGVNVGFMILKKSLINLLKNKSQDFETIIFPPTTGFLLPQVVTIAPDALTIGMIG